MKSTKRESMIDRLSALLDGPPNSSRTGEMLFWGTALSALLVGVIVSTTVVVKVRRHNYLEEKARLMRMCRENPRFDPKRCAELLRGSIVTASKPKGKGNSQGYGGGSIVPVEEGEKERLSDITWNHALILDE
jgi:hypothetical protein